MKLSVILSLFALCFSLSTRVGAQIQTLTDLDLQAHIEKMFDIQADDIDYEALYESLLVLYQNPIDLNRASREELQSIFILSERQLNSFFDHLRANGPLLSLYELQVISGLDAVTIENLLPFVTVKDATNVLDKNLFNRILAEMNNFLIIRAEQTLEQKKGYSAPDTLSSGALTSRYLGSPHKILIRYRVSHYKDFSIGFTMEKDQGEQLKFAPKASLYGMDFYSCHVHLQEKGRFKSILVGDYQLQFGQGLLLGAGFSIGKGAETITTTRRSNLGIRPHTSVLETGFFRGGAATYAINPSLQLTGLYSRLKQDAVLRKADSVSGNHISSIQTSGLHRTPNEIAAKNTLNEQVFGIHLLYQHPKSPLTLGAMALQTTFSLPLIRRPSTYNQYEFNGKSNHIAGIHGSYLWENINTFWEIARSGSGGVGAIGGVVASLSKQVDASLLWRNYDRNFHSFYGSAFGENTRNINERGMFWGIKIAPAQKVYFTGYFDVFKFGWLKFRVDAPSAGYEYMARANYQLRKTTNFYALFRTQVKDINTAAFDSHTNLVSAGTKTNYILNADHHINDRWQIKSRLQFSTYTINGIKTGGIALVQDVNVTLEKWNLSGRVALFDTDDYENRQFVFEKDVLYAFSIPAYQGIGLRNYLVVQYRASDKLRCWVRFARTSYRHTASISSGLEEIAGNVKSDIKLQMMYRFK